MDGDVCTSRTMFFARLKYAIGKCLGRGGRGGSGCESKDESFQTDCLLAAYWAVSIFGYRIAREDASGCRRDSVGNRSALLFDLSSARHHRRSAPKRAMRNRLTRRMGTLGIMFPLGLSSL